MRSTIVSGRWDHLQQLVWSFARMLRGLGYELCLAIQSIPCSRVAFLVTSCNLCKVSVIDDHRRSPNPGICILQVRPEYFLSDSLVLQNFPGWLLPPPPFHLLYPEGYIKGLSLAFCEFSFSNRGSFVYSSLTFSLSDESTYWYQWCQHVPL